jgi:hypothetical protein
LSAEDARDVLGVGRDLGVGEADSGGDEVLIPRAERKWLRAYNWTNALRRLKIGFGDRLPD